VARVFDRILEGPIATTNSLSVGTVRDAISKWMVRTWTWTEICCLPVVAETHDGYLNDIASFFVREGDVFHAIQSASAGPLLEGNVGGGTGMTTYGFKGGVGTSSRVADGSRDVTALASSCKPISDSATS
jgi:D-aminopeptidase